MQNKNMETPAVVGSEGKVDNSIPNAVIDDHKGFGRSAADGFVKSTISKPGEGITVKQVGNVEKVTAAPVKKPMVVKTQVGVEEGQLGTEIDIG